MPVMVALFALLDIVPSAGKHDVLDGMIAMASRQAPPFASTDESPKNLTRGLQ
jgi:hypothetical protein